MSFHYWTDDEYAKSTQQQRAYYRNTLLTEQGKNDDRLSAENVGYAGWKSAVEELELGQKGVRWLQGESLKGLSLAGLADARWQTQDARDFRYHSLPLYNGYGTYVHNVLEEFIKNPSVPLATARAAVLTAEEASKGFPWAKANPDRVESYAMSTLDPMLVSSWLTDGIKAAGAAREIDALMPHANNIMAAAGPKTISRAAEIAKASDALDAAHEGMRIFNSDLAAGFVPAQGRYAKLEKALSRATQGLRDAQALGDNVPMGNAGRDMVLAAKPLWGQDAGSPIFVDAIRDMASKGASPEDVARWMYQEGFRTSEWAAANRMPLSQYFKRGWNLYSPRLKDAAMEKTWLMSAIQKEQISALEHVPDMSQKELAQIQWAMKNIPRSPFDPVGSFVGNWLKAAQEGKVNPMDVAPETFEKMKKVAADLSAGWREDSEWRSAYSPSASKSDYLIGEANEGQSARTWQEHQHNYKAFDNVDDYRRAIARVKTRVYKADSVDGFSRNVGNRLDNIKAALEKMGREYNAPFEMWKDADPGTRNLYNERDALKQMVKDLKLMHDSTDPLRALAEKDPTGAAEVIRRGYLRGMRAIKIAQLRWMPFWAYHRAADMGMRTLLETGSPAIREILEAVKSNRYVPAKDYLGQTMDFAESPIEGLYGGEATGRGLRSGFEPKVTAIDGAAKNYIGQVIYDDNLRRQLAAGVEGETAHKLAMKAARERLDIVHGMYENKSSVQRALDYTHPYAGHYVQRMAYHMTLAAEHPSEAYALTRLREAQEDLSLDRKGALRLGDTDWGFDLPRRLTTTQAMEPFLHTDRILNAPQSFMQKVNRGLQALTGDPFPHVRMLEQAAGLMTDDSSRPITDLESALSFLPRMIAGADVMPSDPLFQLMGKNPGETRAEYTNRLVAIQMAADPKASPGLAQQRAEINQAVNHIGSYLGIVRQSSAESQIYDALRDLRESVLRAPPELKASMREQVINDWAQRGVRISAVAPLDPEARWNAQQKRLGLEATKVDVLGGVPDRSQIIHASGSLPDEAKERSDRFNEVIDAVKASPAGALFRQVYDAVVKPASAADFDEDAFKKRIETLRGADPKIGERPAAPVSMPDYTTLPSGRVYVPSNMTAADRERALHDTSYLNAHLTDLRSLPSVEAQVDYINKSADSEGRNFLRDAITKLANDHANPSTAAQHYASALAFVNGGYKGQLTGDLDQTAQRNTDVFSRAFSQYVAKGGPDAWALASSNPDAVVAAYRAGKIQAPGLGPDAVGRYAAMIAQNSISPGAMGAIKSEWQRQQAASYPGDDMAHAALRAAIGDAQRGDLHVVENTIQKIQDKMAAGDPSISPDFWKNLQLRDATIYSNAAIFAHAPELASVGAFISNKGTDGRFLGVDLPHLVTAMEQPGGNAAIAALREHGSPALRAGIDAVADDYQKATGRSLNDDAPHDKYSIGQFFIHPMNVRTGIETNHWSAHLNEETAGRGPTAALDRAAQGLAHLDLTTAGGLHSSGAPLNSDAQTPSGLPSSSGGAPSRAGSEAAPIKQAALANDFGAAPLVRSVTSGANVTLPSFSEGSTTVRNQPFNSVESYVKQTLEDFHSAKTAWSAKESAQPGSGGPEPSLMDIGYHNLTVSTYARDNLGNTISDGKGGFVMTSTPSVDGARAAGAIDSLASIGDKLGLFGAQGTDSEVTASSAISGLGMALGAHAALATLAPVALGTGPIGWVIAGGIGIAAGLAGGQHHGGDNAAALALQRERIAQQQAQFEEQQRRQSVSELTSREGALAKAASGGGLTPQQRAAMQPQLAAFQRRPTYQSRIGLADSAERAIGSAIHPRW